MRPALALFYDSLAEITAPGTLDGGDICEAGDHFFIGISERTNLDGARQLANFLAQLWLHQRFCGHPWHSRHPAPEERHRLPGRGAAGADRRAGRATRPSVAMRSSTWSHRKITPPTACGSTTTC